MAKKSVWLMAGVVCSLIILVLVVMPKITLRNKMIKHFRSNSATEPILVRDPSIVQALIQDSQLRTIVTNSALNSMRSYGFFGKNYKQFINDLDSNLEVKQVFAMASVYPAAVNLAIDDYDQLMSFVKASSWFRQNVLRNPDFAQYLYKSHPDQFKAIIDSSNPEEKAKAVFQDYILSKYSKKP